MSIFSRDLTRSLTAHVQLMQLMRTRRKVVLAKFIARQIQWRFGVFISHNAVVANSVVFRHPVGIVIGDGVVVGDRVTIYQNVTLGGARVGDAREGNYPEIGVGAVIFAGAAVIGKVRVGKNCVIGANSVVIKDVPDNATAAGAPARVLTADLGPQT